MEDVAGSYPVGIKGLTFRLGVAAMALALAGCGGAANGVGKSPTPTPSPSVSNVSPAPALEPVETPTASPAAAPSARRVAKSPAPAAAPPAKAPPAPPAAAPAPAPDYPTAGRACEDGLGSVDELGALGTDCDTAKRVAAAFHAKVLLLGAIPDEPMNVADGWTCSKAGRQMEELSYIGCDKGDSRMLSVTFGWGT